ncbi:MAG: transcriptional repressor [Bacteroidales bacterium]|jgi:Fur family transcriptional regulator, peroxide stress response regulator|nr:transcriptional repressor [Bacteroidales bacterium]MCI1733899.1 transcriptional repressor [Bacteroidales bacterium]
MQTTKEIIQENGLKATPQRIAVYDTMKQLGHASADMVSDVLKETYPTLTKATVYNVLESFDKVGLLVRRYSSNNKMYFDVNTYDHVHLYDCAKNGYEDYDDPELVALVNNYLAHRKIPGFSVKKIDIQIIGTTDKDQKNRMN